MLTRQTHRESELVFPELPQKEDILFGSIEQCSTGNKQWKLPFTINRGSLGHDKPENGVIACHKTGNFTTYAVCVAGQEFWFDMFELALKSLQ